MKSKSLLALCKPSANRSSNLLFAVALSTLLASQSAFAATRTWSGASSVDWATAGNWSALPVAADILTFAGTTNTATNNNITADTSFAGINFTNTGNGQSFSLGGNRITLGGNIVTTGLPASPATDTITDTISLAMILDATRTITTNTRHNLTISGTISQSSSGFGITKVGPATLTLSGANTFSGPVSVQQGVLSVNSIADSGTSALGFGALSLGNLTTAGTLTYTGDTAAVTNRAITLAGTTGGATINTAPTTAPTAATSTLTLTGTFTTGTGGAKSVTFAGGNTGANTVSSLLANATDGSTLTVIKNGTGNWALTNANNSFTGIMAVQQGTLTVSSIKDGGTASNIGAGTSIRFGNAASEGTLIYTGGTQITNRTVQIGNNSATPVNTDTGGGVIQNDGGGLLTFNATTFNTALDTASGTGANRVLTLKGSNNGEITGIIQNNTNSGGLGTTTVGVTKAGTGTWTLSGTADNTFTGVTTVNGGILALNKTAGVNATSSTAITIGDGTTTSGNDVLRLDASNQLVDNAALTFNGTGSDAGIFRLNSFSETLGGLVSTGGAGVIENGASGTSLLTLTNTTNRSFTGILQNGGGGTLALTKTGSGIQTLSGANTYTGTTTVNAGTLQIGGTGGRLTGTTDITVNAGATLSSGSTPNTENNGVANRINSAATLTLNGGTYTINQAATSTSQSLAALNLGAGSSTINTGLTGSSTLTFSGAAGTNYVRSLGGTVDFAVAAGFTPSFSVAPSETNSVVAGATTDDNILMGATLGGADFIKAAAGTISAATYTNTGTTTWTTGKNMNVTGSVTAGSGLGANSVRFATANAYTVTLAGTNTIAGGILVTSGVGAKLNLITGGTIQAASGRDLVIINNNLSSNAAAQTIASTIADNGTSGLTLSGTGLVKLTGTANTYVGATRLNGGILDVAKLADINTNSSIGKGSAAGSAADLVLDGGTLRYTGTTATSTNRPYTLTVKGGTFNASGTTAGTMTLSGDMTVSGSSGAQTLTLAGTGTSTNGYGTISGAIGNGSGTNVTSVTKSGAGAWVMSGAQTYTGTTTVSEGNLTLSGSRSANAGAITMNTGTAVLNLQNTGTYSTGTITLGSGGSTSTLNQSAGAITSPGGSGLIMGNGGTKNTSTYALSGGSLNTSIIMGTNASTDAAAHVTNFNLSGTGALTSTTLRIGRYDATGAFNTDNTFAQTGGTATVTNLGLGGSTNDAASTNPISAKLNLTGGTFSATNFASLSAGGANTSTITIGGTAQVTLPAFPTVRGTASTATITFDTTVGGGGFLAPQLASTTYMPAGTFTNAYLSANGADFKVADGKDITIGQVLENKSGDAGKLTKSDAGKLTLSSASTYSGATVVNGGTLLMGDAAADTFATTAVTVASGAKLGGSGVIAGTVGVTGILAPGIAGIGTLAAGTTTWTGGDDTAATIWQFDLGASSSDRLNITGDFVKAGSGTYKFDFMGTIPTWGATYTLVDWSTNIIELADFAVGDFSYMGLGSGFSTSYFTINGNQLNFTAVPEPTSALAGLLITAGLLRRRRRA